MREHVKYGSNNSRFINLGGMYCQQMRPGTHRLGSKDSDLEVLRSPGNGDSPAVLRREAVGMFAEAGRETTRDPRWQTHRATQELLK